ncbi:DUF5107 domain-containing protein [Natronospora cellulosivora (SeqCode)]
MSEENFVKLWEEEVEIPTYPLGEPDKNPMFLEKRVYQGSSGKVYPLPFIDKIYDEKIMKKYKVVYLENKYLRIEVLPELGGRIQRAYDKTNDYDFVYYNQVIKPALVGLRGPWISGGIEFNWPQHHRPRTFSPVEYFMEEKEDGSKVLWLGEIDRMYGTKGMAGLVLYPDKAYLEIRGQLYNRTSSSQTFLWWANPAVAVNDQYKSVFPPDVNAVFDHGKRDVSKFPIATGEYYKADYSAGVDISMYKNIPVPTSYMAYKSDYDFVGGYDYGKEAGILHVADHHISPGKKQWTWGNGDFGERWERSLTDEDGPYIELMTGVYTDNQPDFTWLKPYEEKTFKQYFMPYKEVAEVKNANIDVLLNLEFNKKKDHLNDDTARISLYATSVFKGLRVVLSAKGEDIFEEKIDISPEKAYNNEIKILKEIPEEEYKLAVYDADDKLIIDYQPASREILETPDPAEAALEPEEIKTNEELFLTGLHLEQYRHATYQPDDYYLEGLKRDPEDIRINNAYGKLLYKRGLFAESEKYFRKAIEKLTWKNPNPYDGEAYFNLGLTLEIQGKEEEAYSAFYKSVWSDEWQHSGFYHLALLASRKGDYSQALEFTNKSIIRNYHNTKARNLKTILLRKMGKLLEAEKVAKETLEIDRLDFLARNELYNIYRIEKKEKAEYFEAELIEIMRDSYHNYLETALDYSEGGFYAEAIELLERRINSVLNNLDKKVEKSLDNKLLDNKLKDNNLNDGDEIYPLLYYYTGYYYFLLGEEEQSIELFKKAELADPAYCFPVRLSSIPVLEKAIELSPANDKALYYLGNLYYDKKQYKKAVDLWEKSIKVNKEFPTVFRNLALAYYNKFNDSEKARAYLEKAFTLDRQDARVLFELDQLYKNIGVGHQDRLSFLEKNEGVLKERDDLYIEYISLYNNIGEFQKALDLLLNHSFHPWEGGEGKVTGQYRFACRELAKKAIKKREYSKGIELLERAKSYPENLGEGKLPISTDNDLDYYIGSTYLEMQEADKARVYLQKALEGADELGDMMYYNDQPADLVFYQALALKNLGEIEQAKAKFNKLYDYGEKHIFDEVKIDYFAVSLPDFLVFEADLEKKNKVHCHYLMGLGLLGLGDKERAKRELEKAHSLDINHQGVMVFLKKV